MLPVILLGLFLLFPGSLFAETLYLCQIAGTSVYTNHTPKGAQCSPLSALPPLSVVPSAPSTPHTVIPAQLPTFSHTTRPHEEDHPLVTDVHGGFAIHPAVGENVAEQVCDLYGKWLDLSLKTRGGLYYDSLTAPLLSMFGGGYIPMECRRAP